MMDSLSDHHLVFVIAAALTASLFIYRLYQAWNGPLAHLPGPALSKFTGFANEIHKIKGDRIYWLQQLHDEYGPIVRVAPTEVSVAELEATKEIHKAAGGYQKSDFYTKFVSSPIQTMFNSLDSANHNRWRRLLGNSMSESTLKSFDPVIRSKIDILTAQWTKEHAQKGHIDLYKWMHFFATDVIGELSFGESFRMLELGQKNQYIKDVQETGRNSLIFQTVTGRSVVDMPKLPIWPLREQHERIARLNEYGFASLDRYDRHVAMNPDEPKPMFFNKVMGSKGRAAALTREEINAQAQGFIIAGTDTTAVSTTNMVWDVLKHPAAKAKLLQEIEHLPENPTNEELRAIPYLDHLMEETLRIHGAAPAPLPRVVPAGGRTLGGYYVPQGATVSPVAHVLHRNPDIFPEPEQWIPERWEKPTKEMKEAFTAFGGGSRVCIGLHLAKMEMRAALVALFKRFPDLQIAYGDEGFSDGDMQQLEFFLLRAKGGRCLLK